MATVGFREWLAMSAILRSKDETLTVREIRAVLAARRPGDVGRDVPVKLLSKGLVECTVAGDGHTCTLDCSVRLTDVGLSATLSARGHTDRRKGARERSYL